jgi:hypothetical protein
VKGDPSTVSGKLPVDGLFSFAPTLFPAATPAEDHCVIDTALQTPLFARRYAPGEDNIIIHFEAPPSYPRAIFIDPAPPVGDARITHTGAAPLWTSTRRPRRAQYRQLSRSTLLPSADRIVVERNLALLRLSTKRITGGSQETTTPTRTTCTRRRLIIRLQPSSVACVLFRLSLSTLSTAGL